VHAAETLQVLFNARLVQRAAHGVLPPSDMRAGVGRPLLDQYRHGLSKVRGIVGI
jgi:hypothetical protein